MIIRCECTAVARSRWVRHVAGVLVLNLMLAGCADLGAVREFAGTSADAAGYRSIVAGYTSACERQRRYQPASQHARLDDCTAARAAQAEALLARQRVVEAYMEALGRLAADETVLYAAETQALAKATQDAGALDQAQAGALSALGSVVLRASTDGWRRTQVAQLIEQANAPLQTVLAGMRDFVEYGAIEDGEAEGEAMRKHYEGLWQASTDPAGRAALAEWRELRANELASRQQAKARYAVLLGEIAAAHQTLYENRGRLSAPATVAQLRAYSRDIKAAARALYNL